MSYAQTSMSDPCRILRGLPWFAALMFVLSGCYKMERHVPENQDAGDDASDDGGADGSADVDTDSDTDVDADGDTDTACATQLDGQCADFSNGCASCGEGALVNNQAAGCPDQTWCCIPYAPPQNPCERGGGICIPFSEKSRMPVIENVPCPPGWDPSDISCSDVGASCCMPGDDCGI